MFPEIQSAATFMEALSKKAGLSPVENAHRWSSFTLDTSAFHRTCREAEVLPCRYNVTNSSPMKWLTLTNTGLRCGKEICAITMFEQRDSGEMRKLKCSSQV